jgi:L-threonylcarbamoyladenylate synthase
MKTQLLRLDLQKVALTDIRHMADVLERGGLMVFPTDTFYGLGGDGFSRTAIRRIYALKQRDTSKPLLVLVSDVDMVQRLAKDIPAVFGKIAEEFWPGPLTIVLPASEVVPGELCGGGDSVAMRLPAVSWLQALVRETGCPVIATSANISGEGEISTADRALEIFSGKVELVVDGGPSPGGALSTVLDLTVEPPRIIRAGAVAVNKLKKYW